MAHTRRLASTESPGAAVASGGPRAAGSGRSGHPAPNEWSGESVTAQTPRNPMAQTAESWLAGTSAPGDGQNCTHGAWSGPPQPVQRAWSTCNAIFHLV